MDEDVLPNDFAQPCGVRLRYVSEGTCNSLQHEVIDGKFRGLVLVGQRLVENLPQLENLVHVDVEREVVVRQLLL